MRGEVQFQGFLFTTVSPESMVPADHPLRAIKKMADEVLGSMSSIFDQMYCDTGRASIPPERLLKSQLLIALFSVRSERLFCEMLQYNILFRWFLDMSLEDRPIERSTFSLNRDRLLEMDVAREFFSRVVQFAKSQRLLSDEHFTVDGTLIESWASLKSFKPKDQPQDRTDDDPKNPSVNFRGQQRRNDTHESSTDPEARLMRKGPGKEAKLSYGLHLMTENRHGLVVEMELNQAGGRSEVKGAKKMIRRYLKVNSEMSTVGADKGYHSKKFVRFLRKKDLQPHVATIDGRHVDGLDRRTTRTWGYRLSQIKRKLVEEGFGWLKTTGGFRKSRFVGRAKNEFYALIATSAFNLVRISNLTHCRA